MFPQQTPELMIISTIHNKPCKYTPGDHYNFMSIVNKQVRTLFLSTFQLAVLSHSLSFPCLLVNTTPSTQSTTTATQSSRTLSASLLPREHQPSTSLSESLPLNELSALASCRITRGCTATKLSPLALWPTPAWTTCGTRLAGC